MLNEDQAKLLSLYDSNGYTEYQNCYSGCGSEDSSCQSNCYSHYTASHSGLMSMVSLETSSLNLQSGVSEYYSCYSGCGSSDYNCQSACYTHYYTYHSSLLASFQVGKAVEALYDSAGYTEYYNCYYACYTTTCKTKCYNHYVSYHYGVNAEVLATETQIEESSNLKQYSGIAVVVVFLMAVAQAVRVSQNKKKALVSSADEGYVRLGDSVAEKKIIQAPAMVNTPYEKLL